MGQVEGWQALAVNPMSSGELPYLDQHEIVIVAGVDAVWTALLDTVGPTFSRTPMTVFARAVGCADREASGPRPLTEGSTIPGFHVVTVVPGVELLLEGSHRFSRYAMMFRLEQVDPGRSRLRVESRADFPGTRGRIYRLLVVGSGGHVVSVRRMLSSIARRTESCRRRPSQGRSS